MKKPLSVSCLFAIAVLSVTLSVLGQTPAPVSGDVGKVNHYIQQLKDENGDARINAAEALGAMGPQAKDAVPALTEMLGTSAPVERIGAAMALARIGPNAKAAVPTLRNIALNDADPNVKKVAQLAADAIEPPVTETVKNLLLSPYILATAIALGGGLIAFFVLGRRHSSEDDDPAKKSPAAATPKPVAKETKAAPAPAPAAEAPVVGAQSGPLPQDRSARPRARVSRPLPGFANYVTDQEGPDSVKRELVRAQEDLKRIVETQKQLDEHIASEDLARDPARARAIRKDADVYASERYRAEVRVKALEIKMLEVLIDQNRSADAELRGRSEATLKQKWDDLRTLCETPAKIVYKSGQWVSVATAPTSPIPDLRAWLRDYDVVFSERKADDLAEQTPAGGVEALAEEPQAGESATEAAVVEETGGALVEETGGALVEETAGALVETPAETGADVVAEAPIEPIDEPKPKPPEEPASA